MFWQPSRGQQTPAGMLWLCGSGVQLCWSWSSWVAPPKVRNLLFVSGHWSPVPSSREHGVCLCSWGWNPYSLRAVSTQVRTAASWKCSGSVPLRSAINSELQLCLWPLGRLGLYCCSWEAKDLVVEKKCTCKHGLVGWFNSLHCLSNMSLKKLSLSLLLLLLPQN